MDLASLGRLIAQPDRECASELTALATDFPELERRLAPAFHSAEDPWRFLQAPK